MGESETERVKDNIWKVLVGRHYTKGLSEELRRTFSIHRVDSFFKPRNTLHQLLCSPKDPAKKEETCGMIYKINCEGISKDCGCRITYIGETGRTLKARFAEHQWPSTRTSEVVATPAPPGETQTPGSPRQCKGIGS